MENKEKKIIISNIIRKQHYLYFRLYNVLYLIIFREEKFFIGNTSCDIKKEYSTLKQLFDDYVIYGASLSDLINDIKF